jgi:hypothetical protein
MSKKKPGAFDEAINVINSQIMDFGMAFETGFYKGEITLLRAAIRVLRACEKAEVVEKESGYGYSMSSGRREYRGEVNRIHIPKSDAIARAILAARKAAERGKP